MNKEVKRLRSAHDNCHYCGDAIYWAATLRVASVWTEGAVLPVLRCPRCGASNTAEIGSGVGGLFLRRR